MAHVDLATLRSAKNFARMDYERQRVQEGGASAGLDDAGPPHWNRASWEAFRAKYGFYPFSANQLPPTLAGAPDWVYDLMGLRKPPVSVGL